MNSRKNEKLWKAAFDLLDHFPFFWINLVGKTWPLDICSCNFERAIHQIILIFITSGIIVQIPFFFLANQPFVAALSLKDYETRCIVKNLISIVLIGLLKIWNFFYEGKVQKQMRVV